jgi:hypothetical protein
MRQSRGLRHHRAPKEFNYLCQSDFDLNQCPHILTGLYIYLRQPERWRRCCGRKAGIGI